MALDQRVSLFTTKMRTEFQLAYDATAAPAAWQNFTTVIPSTARIEHYNWLTPTPGFQQYVGHRRYARLEAIKYTVENVEFDAAFSAMLRDVDDDQTDGYSMQVKQLADRAKLFPGRWTLKHLAAAKTRKCFDGTSMAADSHDVGTGDNLMDYDAASNDAAALKLAALYTGGPLKPLIWQSRKEPKLDDNSNTTARESKELHFWCDLEGQSGYSWWWNMIWMDITDTPNVSEAQEILSRIQTRFRTFQLPKALASDDGEYVHEQTTFTSDNFVLVGSPALEPIFRQALGQDWIPQNIGNNTVATTNQWKGAATFVPSKFMDG